MKQIRNTIADFIRHNFFVRVAVGFIVTYVLLSAFAYFAGNAIASMTPRDYFYDYKSVEFVDFDGQYLVFASDRQLKHSYPIYFNDVLFCNGKRYRFYSYQDTNNQSPKTTSDYHKVEWVYNEPFPKNTRCYLESHITMKIGAVEKKQDVRSGVFVVEEQ